MKKEIKIKFNKKTLLILLSITLIALSTNFCYGATAVAIKPSTVASSAEVWVDTTVSNSFDVCRNMKNKGQALEGCSSNVEPHLALNADWGAVSYLSQSSYGTNGAGGNTGTQVEITTKNASGQNVNVKYYSTNGNKTGIMNWGENPYKVKKNSSGWGTQYLFTQTAGLVEQYLNQEVKKDHLKSLEENSNSKFVEINLSKNGTAISETNTISAYVRYSGASTNYPISIRQGLFGYAIGHESVNWTFGNPATASFPCNGQAYSYVTFRPVIWNS